MDSSALQSLKELSDIIAFKKILGSFGGDANTMMRSLTSGSPSANKTIPDQFDPSVTMHDASPAPDQPNPPSDDESQNAGTDESDGSEHIQPDVPTDDEESSKSSVASEELFTLSELLEDTNSGMPREKIPKPEGSGGREFNLRQRIGIGNDMKWYIDTLHSIHHWCDKYLATRYSLKKQDKHALIFVERYPIRALIQQYLKNSSEQARKSDRRHAKCRGQGPTLGKKPATKKTSQVQSAKSKTKEPRDHLQLQARKIDKASQKTPAIKKKNKATTVPASATTQKAQSNPSTATQSSKENPSNIRTWAKNACWSPMPKPDLNMSSYSALNDILEQSDIEDDPPIAQRNDKGKGKAVPKATQKRKRSEQDEDGPPTKRYKNLESLKPMPYCCYEKEEHSCEDGKCFPAIQFKHEASLPADKISICQTIYQILQDR
ncbi:hypothetical protein K439DRAFT_1663044 [Ramaria rubella]|nr:hypothetical protein K439DRAFT_1663044 [Ramaria rubella]